jgi:hypothetical protein
LLAGSFGELFSMQCEIPVKCHTLDSSLVMAGSSSSLKWSSIKSHIIHLIYFTFSEKHGKEISFSGFVGTLIGYVALLVGIIARFSL